jgi:hypothetical protein
VNQVYDSDDLESRLCFSNAQNALTNCIPSFIVIPTHVTVLAILSHNFVIFLTRCLGACWKCGHCSANGPGEACGHLFICTSNVCQNNPSTVSLPTSLLSFPRF